MKKFLAMILSAVMLISCLAIMPIGATDNAPATAEDVLYHVDFTKKYAELGLTEATATGNLLSQIMYSRHVSLTEARNIVKETFQISEVRV